MNIMNCTCEYCGQLHHIPGCPNYKEYKAMLYVPNVAKKFALETNMCEMMLDTLPM